MGYQLVDVLIYAGVSLLHQFFRDCATIDKTLFYDICSQNSVKFEANFRAYHNFKRSPGTRN